MDFKFLYLFLFFSIFSFSEVKFEEKEGDYGKEITLTNEFLSITIYPEMGGRIGKLIDKKSGINMVFFDYPPEHPKWKGGLGGALDDRVDRYKKRYDYRVIKKTEDEASIYLELPREKEEDIIIKKFITLKKNTPSIYVEYHYLNYTDKETGSYELAIRNFFWPSGEPPNWEKDKLFIPTIKTVREIGDNSNLPDELKGKFQLDIMPTWNAFIDKKNKRGLVFTFNDDFYRWFYRWIKGETATYEWIFSNLPPGKEGITKFNISVINGLDGCVDASEKYVLNLIFNKDTNGYKVKHQVYPLYDLKDLRIVSIITDKKSDVNLSLPDIEFGSLKAGNVYEKEVFWNIKEGWIIKQRIYSGKELLGEYEIPFPIDKPPADYTREKKGKSKFVMKDIPDFKLKEKEDILQITEKDEKRGYIVYRDYFAFEKDRGKDTEKIELYVGKDELEAVSLKIRIFRDLGQFEIITEDKRINLYVQEEEGLKLEKSGLEGKIGYKLVRDNKFTSLEKRDKTIWLIWDGRNVKSGIYEIPLLIKPEKGEPKEIICKINIFDIKLPERNIFEFEAEGYLLSSYGSMCKWNENLWEKYINDLSLHRVNIAQIFSGWEKNYIRLPKEIEIKILPKGEPIGKSTRVNGNFIDFSSWDKWIEKIIEAGLTRVYIRENGLEERTEDEKWMIKELARYLEEKGYTYRDRILKFVDEMPAEFYPKMADIGNMYNNLGWRVLHTCFPVRSKIQMSILNPSTDFWHGPIPEEKDREERIKEGNLDLTDEIWTYSGWGAVWASYESRRTFAWRCISNNLNGMHLHVYYRGSLADALIFPSEDGPIPSAAWEGARDGVEDGQYFYLAKQWIKNLKENNVWDERLKNFEYILKEISEKFKKVENITYEEIIRAKLEVLNILKELKNYEKHIKPSIFYGFDNLVIKGIPKYILSGDEEISNRFNEKIYSRCNLKFNYYLWEKVEKKENNFILFLTLEDDIREFLKDEKLRSKPVNYPKKGSYSIYKITNPYAEGKQIIIVLGGDKEGLLKGMSNFYRFLRFEPEKF
ncbi:MAG: DUF5107 domain-containing protein [Candidatus Omnitrophica bacterium]|nr:DUF5107 domain-containing protein [Candidatus Omnitrophota bacterium]MCM8802385.1 DUF5107 domain-containing protein [Candidatus Omnitrophota bacterium]